MKNIIIVLLSVIIFSACNTKKDTTAVKSTTIQISFKGVELPVKVYLVNIGASKSVVIDSVEVNGSEIINFEVEMAQASDIYMLKFSPSDVIRLILNEGETVNVSINNIPVIDNYTISGSKSSQLVQKYYQLIEKHIDYHDSVYTQYRNASKDDKNIRIRTDSLLKNNYFRVYNELKSMVLDNTNDLASLLGVYSKFGNSSILDFDLDYNVFKQLSDSLIKIYPNNTHCISLKTKVSQRESNNALKEKRYNNLDKHHKFPYLSLLKLDETKYTIDNSSIKYRIVYLWKPNKRSFFEFNKVLHGLYAKYDREELEIIGISFEKDKLAWSNLCKIERMNWINLIAEQNTESLINPKEEYSLVYILDTENKIIARIYDANLIEQYLK